MSIGNGLLKLLIEDILSTTFVLHNLLMIGENIEK